MSEHQLLELVTIFVLGIVAQWVSWRFKLPAILLLLVFGILAGPVLQFMHIGELFGDLLMPVVSLSVAIILFEGGLSLRFSELRQIVGPVRNLATLGALVTWLLAATAAHWVLGLRWDFSLLLGAIVVVSGPTVVLPLLRTIKPSAKIGSLLKWEAILIDPVGATLALLVFEAISASDGEQVFRLAALGIGKTLLAGGLSGVLAAVIVILLLWRYLVPNYLENSVVLMAVVASYAAANHFQAESGLLAVTVMGVILANQSKASIRHIVEFKENLRVLLISALFILLAANIRKENLLELSWMSFVFVAVLILVVRPISVALCTWGSKLTRKEKIFVAWVAPRGIVAAAVSSVFAMRLAQTGHPQANLLVPLTFLTIMVTVLVYGLTATPLARKLGISHPNPQGALIVGAHRFGRSIGKILQEEGLSVRMVDSNWHHVSDARMADLSCSYISILADQVVDEIELAGIGKLLALTPNDEVNSLAVLHCTHLFERSQLYQFARLKDRPAAREAVSRTLRGRTLFAENLTYDIIEERMERGAVVKKTELTEQFDYQAFLDRYKGGFVPLFVITQSGRLEVVTADGKISPSRGDAIIALIDEGEKPPEKRKEQHEKGKAEKSDHRNKDNINT